ncbi:MAG: Flp pilus assembly protein CpaB [Proteobacteria bacterium]|nr:Flp pilus assembly protein CpaB [Pseudomonadota bacterium]
MSVRNIILILVAVAITAGTGLVARSWISSQRLPTVAAAPPPPVKKMLVLVADKDLPAGTFIKENSLTWQSWSDEKPHPSYLIKNRDDETRLYGAVVRRGIAAGQPITSGRIVKAGDRGFLAAVLRPGYRAVSLRINATSSIAGLIFPGDRVDIILTHSVKADGPSRRVSETVLTNVRILAIDQKTDDQDSAPKLGKNATFEVTPKQAEMLSVLSDLGKLSLSLRSLAKDEAELQRLANTDDPLAEPDPTKGKTHTWDSEVSHLIRRPSAMNQQKVQVIRGSRTTELRFDKGQLVGSISLDPDSADSEDTIKMEFKIPKPQFQESEPSSEEKDQ